MDITLKKLETDALMALSKQDLKKIIASVPGVLTECGLLMGYKYKTHRWVAGQSFKRALLKGSTKHYECLSANLKKNYLKTQKEIKQYHKIYDEKELSNTLGLVK